MIYLLFVEMYKGQIVSDENVETVVCSIGSRQIIGKRLKQCKVCAYLYHDE